MEAISLGNALCRLNRLRVDNSRCAFPKRAMTSPLKASISVDWLRMEWGSTSVSSAAAREVLVASECNFFVMSRMPAVAFAKTDCTLCSFVSTLLATLSSLHIVKLCIYSFGHIVKLAHCEALYLLFWPHCPAFPHVFV